jgi:hypothetical protein
MKDGRHSYCWSCNNRRSNESRHRLHGGSRHYHPMRRYRISAAEFDELVGEAGRRVRYLRAF